MREVIHQMIIMRRHSTANTIARHLLVGRRQRSGQRLRSQTLGDPGSNPGDHRSRATFLLRYINEKKCSQYPSSSRTYTGRLPHQRENSRVSASTTLTISPAATLDSRNYHGLFTSTRTISNNCHFPNVIRDCSHFKIQCYETKQISHVNVVTAVAK